MNPALRIRELIFGHVACQLVAAMVRLGIVDALGRGPRPAGAVAAEVGVEEGMMHRLLRAGVKLDLLADSVGGEYALAPAGECLLPGPRSLRHLALAMAAPAHWLSIERLAESVATGEAAPPAALGEGLWDYYAHHEVERAQFAEAMSATSESVADDLLRAFDFTPYQRVVDVGGGRGALLRRILAAAPHASGVLYDRPEIVEHARHDPLTRAGRLDPVGGDFFDAVPPDGDLYLLKHIVHDWDDERALTIVRNCHRAGLPGCTLLLVDRVIDSDSHAVDHLADLLMHVMFAGQERSREEMEAILHAGGFEVASVTPMSMFSLVEARKVGRRP